jgi:DNA-binding GntR family transcriptional regulator
MDRCAGPQLGRIYAGIRPHVQRYEWACCGIAEATYEPSIAEHGRIIAAVEAGDAAGAGDLVKRHWGDAASRTRALMVRAGLSAP